MRPLQRFPFVGLLVAALAGCPEKPAERPYPPPTAAELADYLHKRIDHAGTLRTDAKVDYFEEKGDRVKLTMSFLAQPPARLRIDAESPIGNSNVASLASDGHEFQLLDARDNRFLVGAAEPCNIARLIRVRLSPADVIAVLSGGAPLVGEPDAVTWNPRHGGREVLTLRAPSGERETIELGGRRGDWDVLSAELKGADGETIYRLEQEPDSEAIRGIRYPQKTHIEEPTRKVDVRLRYRDREVGPSVTIPPTAFHLIPPAGIPVQTVQCD